ncbi:ankyrin repeat-containing domain protein [Bipolaris maydis]|nr:ankyrin repeat-containing domain protein [Bipolaris maydis]KAJ6271005.1 ankyrin repeat-containing domain protein [Bipolaris maydis]KAJ6278355.1 ankyrin repeat-containing domain protein [Bipolaris maydis]
MEHNRQESEVPQLGHQSSAPPTIGAEAESERRPPTPKSLRQLFLDYDRFYDAVARGDIETVKAMLDTGVDVERQRDDGASPLVIAISKRHADTVQLLLERGIDVDSPVLSGPPIFHAVKASEDAPRLIQLLLDHGADVQATTGPANMTALHWAAVNGMVHAVDFLIDKGLDVDGRCKRGKTALVLAAENGHTTVVKLLLAKGADLHARSGNGGTALVWAASCGHVETARHLIEEGSRLEDRDEDNLTALSIASNSGHLEMVELLIEKGADVNALSTEPRKSTPAVWAAILGYDKVLKTLIRHGADLSVTLNDEVTLIDATLQRGRLNTAKILLEAIVYRHHKDLLRILLDSGADPALPSKNAETEMLTPLHQAVGQLSEDPKKDTSIVDMMLATGKCRLMEGEEVGSTVFAYVLHRFERRENGLAKELAFRMLDSISDVNGDRSDDGCTLMHAAFNEPGLIDKLLQKGADINAKDNYGQTPFLMACRSGPGLLQFLVSRGADAFAVNTDGFSALHIAAANGRVATLEYLLNLDFEGKGKLDIEAKTNRGNTPLMIAVGENHEEAALYLLDRGAAPTGHCSDRIKVTALHLAAIASMHRVADRILAAPDSINEINVHDAKGRSPLAIACNAPSPTIVPALLSHGGHINDPNPLTGNTPLQLALQRPHHMGPRDKRHGDPALILLRHPDIDITPRDSHLRHPLHLASLHHNVPATELLLRAKNASPNCTDKYGKTPLSYASNPHIASLLLEHGANVNHAEPNGWTPVHRAIERCWVNAFGVLVRNGADLEARTGDDGLSARERMESMGGYDRWVRREDDFLIEDVKMEERRASELED